MRVLFAGKQHFDTGGVQASTDQLARRLVAVGHEVTVMASPGAGVELGFGARAALREVDGYGYPAWAANPRAPGAGLELLMGRFRPDAVVVNAGGRWWHDWTVPLVRAASVAPCVLYLNDREALEVLAEPTVRPDMIWSCAESHSLAARALGHDAITVPSLVEPELYRTRSMGEVVLYVNPVKSKGLRTAFTLAAARRDIPFVFLRSWPWADERFAELSRAAAMLGNIEVARATPDPREFYARARLLLAPYEDYGRPRVIAEAQLSGIPALALDDPGNREGVGPGGLLVSRDEPLSAWVEALGRLWDDPDEHHRLADAAVAHSRRPEMDPEAIVAVVEARLEEAIVRARNRAEGTAGGHGQPARAPSWPELVSVVLPVRNVASTIDEQLDALSAQTYAGTWELVVSDNGSTDGTRACVMSWEGGVPAELRIVDASDRRGVAHARNVGVRAAQGEFVLICDGDDVVSPAWIESMVAALRDHEIVTGAGEYRLLNTPDQYEWTGDADRDEPDIGYDYLRSASGGNLGVRRSVALRLAGFDETLRRAEDVDWSWRAQYAGYEVAYQPAAVIHYRLRSDLRAVARTRFRGGAIEPLLYRRHRGRGMRAEAPAEVFDTWRWLARTAFTAVKDPAARNRWTDHAAHRAGRLVGSLRHRTLFL